MKFFYLSVNKSYLHSHHQFYCDLGIKIHPTVKHYQLFYSPLQPAVSQIEAQSHNFKAIKVTHLY